MCPKQPASAKCPHATSCPSPGDMAVLGWLLNEVLVPSLAALLPVTSVGRPWHFWGWHPWGGTDGAVPLSPTAHPAGAASMDPRKLQGPYLGTRVPLEDWEVAEGGVPCACNRVPRRALHMPVNFTPSALDGSLVFFGKLSHKFVSPHCSELISGDGRAPMPGTLGWRPAATPGTLLG